MNVKSTEFGGKDGTNPRSILKRFSQRTIDIAHFFVKFKDIGKNPTSFANMGVRVRYRSVVPAECAMRDI